MLGQDPYHFLSLPDFIETILPRTPRASDTKMRNSTNARTNERHAANFPSAGPARAISYYYPHPGLSDGALEPLSGHRRLLREA